MASRQRGQHVDGWGVGWPAAPPPSLSESLIESFFRWLAGFWVELAVLAAVAGGLVEAYWVGLLWPALALLLTVTVGLLLVRPARRWVAGGLHAQSVRREWSRAVRIAAIERYAGSVPSVTHVRKVPAGDVLDAVIPVGGTAEDLAESAEILAVTMSLRDVEVTRDADNAARARVVLVRRDPLAESVPAWPNADSETLSLWEPIPVGVDEAGDPVHVTLPERNVLLGGEPGAGKSVALSMLVATAALDASVQLHLLDGKLVELATWAGCADHNVGVSTAQANEVLRELQTVMDNRYVTLLANRTRKVTHDLGLPLHLLVVDELSHYLLAPDRKERTEFAELMRDLVARGRAAGLIVVAATQKPSHDVIPTSLRDLFGFRWAMRCSTWQASDTILGSGWASLGYSAADIDAKQRGVGYLLHEGGQPIRLRSHYCDDEVLTSIAERAERLRQPDRTAS